MRTLAIDWGARRVGLALSDESGRLATPYAVLEVGSPEHAVERIVEIVRKEGARRLVVGLPLDMNGTTGPSAKATVAQTKQLANRAGVPVIYVDERLSSFDAEQRLVERKRQGEKITRKRRKQQLDAVAAAGFLQAFLDGRLSAIDPT